MTYGVTIRELRELHGLSQQALAERVGMSLPAVSQWEREIIRPKRSTASKIDAALNADGAILAALGYANEVSQLDEISRLRDAVAAQSLLIEELSSQVAVLMDERAKRRRGRGRAVL